MIKKLVSFDFDSTLFHTPTPETGVPQWEEFTGNQWPGRGWWGNGESLNINVFYPTLNDWVYKYYQKYINDPEAYVFVATGRLKRLESHVQKFLDFHNIDCDLFCNTGGETYRFKTRLFEEMIKEFKTATELIMFDDRKSHIDQFATWAKFQPINVEIIDVINKVKVK